MNDINRAAEIIQKDKQKLRAQRKEIAELKRQLTHANTVYGGLFAHNERLMVLAHAILQGEDIPWLLDKATMLVNVTPFQSLAKHNAEVIQKMYKKIGLNLRSCTCGLQVEDYISQLERDCEQ